MVPMQKNALNYKKKCEIFLKCFRDVSKIEVNSKILIISGTPIRVIFQNSVTYLSNNALLLKSMVSFKRNFPDFYTRSFLSTSKKH